MASVGEILSTSMGGSSGVLLSDLLTAASKAMADKADLAVALLAGLDRMTFYGGAGAGDRTMVDALAPALSALVSGDVVAAAKAAAAGARSTKAMRTAKAGRASYVGERIWRNAGSGRGGRGTRIRSCSIADIAGAALGRVTRAGGTSSSCRID